MYCISFREMFHASRWLNDARFYSPMACLFNGTHAFIRDCVSYRHPALGVVTCIIVQYFIKVRLWTNIQLLDTSAHLHVGGCPGAIRRVRCPFDLGAVSTGCTRHIGLLSPIWNPDYF